jgi:E3 ubiquitin-protein ligase UBR7
VCYACSVQCHGEHTLVEIFTKRNFTCDCGTTRFPAATNPCGLRVNKTTNTKGGVHSEEPDANNKYNQNFRNRFCSCEGLYDPFLQKGTMFQCLGLGTHDTGGCGEDWYHPGCLVGLGPRWFEAAKDGKAAKNGTAEVTALPTISEDAEQEANGNTPAMEAEEEQEEDNDVPLPDGFPAEEDFDGFICYKCVDAHPWIRKYAGTAGFLPALFSKPVQGAAQPANGAAPTSKKRKADEDVEMESESKRAKSEVDDLSPAPVVEAAAAEVPKEEPAEETHDSAPACKHAQLQPAPEGQFSLFYKENFRDRLCRCASCYPNLNPHPQLLEEEEIYQPPISEDGSEQGGGSTHGSGSLYERGESALRNVDRVRAIEGVMAYNHLKEQLKPFFQQFAESGKAIGAEDIKAYFAKLRGDDQAIEDAGAAAASSSKKDEDGDISRQGERSY